MALTELELDDVDEGRRLWLEERRSGVGASEVAALGNVPGAHGSPWSVWVDKVGLVPLDSPPSPAMQLGRDLEPVIASWFTNRTGLELGGEQTFVRHPDAPHRFATLDRLALEAGGETLGPVELKYSSLAFDGLPEPYRWQVNWQMHVAGYEYGWLAALQFPYGRPRFDVWELELDEVLVLRQCQLVDRFWLEHVVPQVPPFDIDDSSATAEAIAAAWAHRSTVAVPTVPLDDLADVVAEWAELEAKHKALGKLVDRRKNQIRARFGDYGLELDADSELGGLQPSEGTIRGELAVSWRASKPRDAGVDVAAVRRDHGDRYDRPAGDPVRRLLLHGGYAT